MKKILLAVAFIGFAIAQTNAQNPAPAAAKKTTPTGVQAANPAVNAPLPAKQDNVKPVKPAPKVAPATVRNGKPVMHKQGARGKKSRHVVKENKDAAKPMAPGTDNKK